MWAMSIKDHTTFQLNNNYTPHFIGTKKNATESINQPPAYSQEALD